MANLFVPISVQLGALVGLTQEVKWAVPGLATNVPLSFHVELSEDAGSTWTEISETLHRYIFVALQNSAILVRIRSENAAAQLSAYCTPIEISVEIDKLQTGGHIHSWADIIPATVDLTDIPVTVDVPGAAYDPAEPTDWGQNPPTTIAEALDALAARITALEA